MTILLIKPQFNTHIITPAIGIGYLASYLKTNGYNAVILDALKENMNNDDVVEYTNKLKPQAVGISVLSVYKEEAFDLCKKLKKCGFKVIIGGIHPTFEPYETLKESNCDYVIAGEGEIALLNLAKNNYINNNIKGVYSIKEISPENTSFEKADIIENLDNLPFPDWQQINPASYPIAPYGVLVKKNHAGAIMCSRGCPYSCVFCSSCNTFGKKVRFRSPKNVVDEIEFLYKNFNIKEIKFIDDNLTLKKDYVIEVCKQIINRNIKIFWSCPNGIRADKFDEEIAFFMKKSGCYYITFGIESADDNILKNVKKQENIQTIEKAINIASKYRFITSGNFIFGLPGETTDTINKTIDFAVKSKLDLAQFAILTALPGSELYKNIDSKNNIKFTSHFTQANYNFCNLKNEDLILLQGKAFRLFYLSHFRIFKLLKYIKPYQIKFLIKRLKDYNFFKNKYNKKRDDQ